ncbi:MAG TPA: hypothetical protein VKR30_05880 [Candidatus Limnocylindrales bacterium]|nr:hypothetical protein [Candidatus Limnocylindrales bacterium]
MENRRNSLLADIGREASIERTDYLARAGEQLQRFMTAHANRIRALGGLTLIDDEDDFLAVAPDGTFRSRSRVYDEQKGEWVSETEVIETAAELVELYNPADVLQAFADADDSDLGAKDPVEAGDGDGATGILAAEEAPKGTTAAKAYAGAADTWAAGQPETRTARNEGEAAEALYDLTLDFQERSQRAESGLIESFENAASALLGQVGTLVIVDDEDEHLALGVGGFRARVVPEGESGWRDLSGAGEIVQFYDPTDVFGDLAEAIAEAYPSLDEGGAGNGDDGDDGDDSDAGDDTNDR